MTDVARASIEAGTQPLTYFNARSMGLEEVVASFVEPPAFETLMAPSHALLSGPRGSGKTTLLKMLQPAALEMRAGTRGVEVNERVRFTGVFIVTDRLWKRQLEPKVSETNQFRPELQLIGNAAFAMHTLRAIVKTMRHRCGPREPNANFRSRVELTAASERRLALNLASLARLEELEPSLAGLEDSLTIRLSRLAEVQNMLRQNRLPEIPNWSAVDCLSLANSAIDIFNRAANDEEHPWALLFDEMELAPTEIVQSVLDSMRGQPQNVLLKLSLSPVQPEMARLHQPFAPIHGQDFEHIQLANFRQRQSVVLGSALMRFQARARGIEEVEPRKLCGTSAFSSFDEGTGGADYADPYRINSSLWRRYKRLYERDASFRTWLLDRDVDLRTLEQLDPDQRAATVRKVRNLVVVREFYGGGTGDRRRSRKDYSLYAGVDSIVAFCDGNPRLMTALLGQLFAPSKVERLPISTSHQVEAIRGIVERFFALIYGAEAVTKPNGELVTLNELVHRIGLALAFGVLSAPFSDNVPLSFTVDKHVSDENLTLLRTGINVGAFIHVPRKPDIRVPLELTGERFRLTYVLAPYFGLPLRLGPARSLSSLLRVNLERERRRLREYDPAQYPLFDQSTGGGDSS